MLAHGATRGPQCRDSTACPSDCGPRGRSRAGPLRNEIRRNYTADERTAHLSRLIDARARLLIDEVGVDDGDN